MSSDSQRGDWDRLFDALTWVGIMVLLVGLAIEMAK